jgi:hypothetical protein
LLAAAVILLAAMEWPRIAHATRLQGRHPPRRRQRKKAPLRLVDKPKLGKDESDEFVRSVEQDLANLPTIDERDRRK